MLPRTVEDVSMLFNQLYTMLSKESIQYNMSEIGLSMYRLLFRIFLLGVNAYVIYRILKPIIKKLKRVIPYR